MSFILNEDISPVQGYSQDGSVKTDSQASMPCMPKYDPSHPKHSSSACTQSITIDNELSNQYRGVENAEEMKEPTDYEANSDTVIDSNIIDFNKPKVSGSDKYEQSPLRIYYELIHQRVFPMIFYQFIRVMRFLRFLDSTDNEEDKIIYAGMVIESIKVSLGFANLTRYAMIKSGNLEHFAEEEAKKRQTSKKEVIKELFLLIGIGMSKDRADDIADLLPPLKEFHLLPEPNIERIPWSCPEELVREVKVHGLYREVIHFLDKLFIDVKDQYLSFFIEFDEEERNGGRAGKMFKALRFPLKRNLVLRDGSLRAVFHYLVKQLNLKNEQKDHDNLSDNQKYIKYLLKQISMMTSTTVRRIRSHLYKQMNNQSTDLIVHHRIYWQITNLLVLYRDDPKDFKSKRLSAYLNIDGTFKEKVLSVELMTFIDNFCKQDKFECMTLIWTKLQTAFTEKKNKEEVFIEEFTNPRCKVITKCGDHSLSGNIIPKALSGHISLSPRYPYMHLRKEGKDYYWFRKMDSGKEVYQMYPTNSSPVEPPPSNPDTYYYTYFPATTDHGMFEVIQMKHLNAHESLGSYCECTYLFFEPEPSDSIEDSVKSLFTLRSYRNIHPSLLYPNYLATCSLMLDDNVHRRMVFLGGNGSGTCYSIISPESPNEFKSQTQAIEFFHSKQMENPAEKSGKEENLILCIAVIVLSKHKFSATFAKVEVVVSRNFLTIESDAFKPNEIKFRLLIFTIANFVHVGEQCITEERQAYFHLATDTFEECKLQGHKQPVKYSKEIKSELPDLKPAILSPLTVAINNFGFLWLEKVGEKELEVRLEFAEGCKYIELYRDLPRVYKMTWD